MLINGMRKSGTHALQCLLGGGEVVHVPFGYGSCDCFIVRDPRNVLLSWLRERGRRLIEPVIIHTIGAFEDATPFAEYAAGFVPWLHVVPVVRFEAITLRGRVPGESSTWTGRLSNWREVWTPAIQEAWLQSGCAAVQEEMGYA